MIRFVDLSKSYWTTGSSPCCAFLETVTDTFIRNTLDGSHVFSERDDVEHASYEPQRCAALIPNGFWDSQEEEK